MSKVNWRILPTSSPFPFPSRDSQMLVHRECLENGEDTKGLEHEFMMALVARVPAHSAPTISLASGAFLVSGA
jgi:hypothetical protein